MYFHIVGGTRSYTTSTTNMYDKYQFHVPLLPPAPPFPAAPPPEAPAPLPCAAQCPSVPPTASDAPLAPAATGAVPVVLLARLAAVPARKGKPTEQQY